ncbi:MAG: DeoR family transcriptional regulator [Parcubacteria group bacterium]|nr:DeoR family transcriptional regulator [Parcubacteria group bacterium]
MDSSFIIRLTLGLYRVTEVFFKNPALRRTTEESASRLLVNLILVSEGRGNGEAVFRALTELEVLLACLQDMKRLRVINDRNFVVLEREYAKVRRFLTRTSLQRAPSLGQTPSVFNPKGLNGRQEKMLEILRYKEKIQVWELKKLLPDVTKRTLRRDVDDLLKRNLVVREGEWNNIFYRINGETVSKQQIPVEKVLGTVGQR